MFAQAILTVLSGFKVRLSNRFKYFSKIFSFMRLTQLVSMTNCFWRVHRSFPEDRRVLEVVPLGEPDTVTVDFKTSKPLKGELIRTHVPGANAFCLGEPTPIGFHDPETESIPPYGYAPIQFYKITPSKPAKYHE